jgi:heme-degrading monooxygenase HmoA
VPNINKNADYVTFINTFRCRPENQDEVVRINAEIIDQVAMGRPGFISASVHRSSHGTRVFNDQEWETADDLTRMQESTEFRGTAGRFAGKIEFEPHHCEVVHIGER